jgi:O-acetyl-ADP-ribose deacetylase (regulator of RNase III)
MQSRLFGRARLELAQGDLTLADVDAIVNAANRTLLGGGGVDGMIHARGGPDILAECRRLGGCETGDAKMTGGGNLVARHVIHTVGPVYRDGRQGEGALLARAYRRSLEVAIEHGLRSVAFPSISTGAYGFPIDEAAPIALGTVADVLASGGGTLGLVRFVLFTARDLDCYARAFAGLPERGAQEA